MVLDNNAIGVKRRRPKTRIEDESLFIAMRLAKAGYYGGNPQAVLQAPVTVVIGMLEYEGFNDEYENAYMALNKEV